MAAPLLLRGVPLLRLRLHQHQLHHRLAAGLLTRRPWCAAAESTRPDEAVSFSDQSAAVFGVKDPLQHPRWGNPDFRKWKDKEDEILRDIEPITFLTKEILHSDRVDEPIRGYRENREQMMVAWEDDNGQGGYMDGERLTAEDEGAVVEKLLAYHPHSEDKIGCGLDSIMWASEGIALPSQHGAVPAPNPQG
ncbi:DCL protein [Actinidia rufa]|uniref:DCL protein n=1 Tax=Actinidia rufa TaxID=165716 RepID=A0A7J0EIC3_9ERIC|nr:DCL protein [Actinidia rufa]